MADHQQQKRQASETAPVGDSDELESLPLVPTTPGLFKEGEVVPLPSGRYVRIRRVHLAALIEQGTSVVPNPLRAAAWRAVAASGEGDGSSAGQPSDDTPVSEEDEVKARAEHYEALCALAVGVVEEPALVMKREEEGVASVWVGRLTPADLRIVTWLAQAELAQLESFRRAVYASFGKQNGPAIRGAALILSTDSPS